MHLCIELRTLINTFDLLSLLTMATHSREEIVAMFDEFRSELDESRDRTERIIKAIRT